MKESIIKQIKDLAAELSKLSNISSAAVTVEVENKTVLEEVACEMKCHLYKPYEGFENHYYFFDYKINDRIRITVKSKEKFKKEIVLVEV